MKRFIRRTLLVLAIVFVAIQLYQPSRSNPPVDPRTELASAIIVHPQAMSAFQRACNDCHSNRTTWPWYSHVAPVSWLVVHDVQEGREALNFSVWSSYPEEKQAKLLKKICDEVREREMPMLTYKVMHPEARLSSEDAQAVCRWTQGRQQAAWDLPDTDDD